MSTIEDRNKRLDDLKEAVKTWAQKRRDQLTKQVARNKAILQGREGPDSLANNGTQTAESIVVDEINDFLTG